MATVFRVINKFDNKVMSFRGNDDVALFLSGKTLENWLVIRSDSKGDKLLKFASDQTYHDLRGSLYL